MSYDPMKGLHLHKHTMKQIKELEDEFKKYLLLSGGTMTGDLKLGSGVDLLLDDTFGKYVHITFDPVNWRFILEDEYGTYAGLFCEDIDIYQQIAFRGKSARIRTAEDVASYLFFQAYNGVAFSNVAKIWSGTSPYLEILLAGDISGLATKTLDFPNVDADQFKVSGVNGADGSFTSEDGKTVTVSKGLITSIV